MISEGIPLIEKQCGVYGNISITRSRLLSTFERILDFVQQHNEVPEREKDIWELAVEAGQKTPGKSSLLMWGYIFPGWDNGLKITWCMG